MKTHFFLPIAAMTMALFMGSCTKEQDPMLTNPELSSINPGQNISSVIPALKPVNLGNAGNFAILSEYGITDSAYSSNITGDIGSTILTGEGIHVWCHEITGNIYSVDNRYRWTCYTVNPTYLSVSQNDMVSAYNYAAGLSQPNYLNYGLGNIGNKMLRPGLYKWTSSVRIPSNMTIYGGPNDVWIFQIDGTLDISEKVKVKLAGGAQAKNIFWVSAGVVTMGAGSHFEGNVLGKGLIDLKWGASINGRLLAQYAVFLKSNTVVKPKSSISTSVN